MSAVATRRALNAANTDRVCGRSCDLDDRWAPVAARLRCRLGDDFELWLAPFHPHHHGPNGWVIAGPVIGRAWVEQRMGGVLAGVAGEPVRVRICPVEVTR